MSSTVGARGVGGGGGGGGGGGSDVCGGVARRRKWLMFAQGNANRIYIHPEGLLRVSKTGRDPTEIAECFERWHQRLPQYTSPIRIVNDPEHGRAILMDHVGRDGTLLVEFKPKWLHQSPDAPCNARACRTCAVDALRDKTRKWCPLALAAGIDVPKIMAAMNCRRPDLVAEFLATTDLLPSLAKYQSGPGVNPDPDQLEEFLDAMSARDCTILIECADHHPTGEGWVPIADTHLRARVVDLDPKQPDQMKKWQDIETSLTPFYEKGVPGCLLYEQT